MSAVANLAIRALAAAAVAAGPVLVAPAPPAGALPPEFPNLDNFAPARVDDYFVQHEKGPRWVNFSTPYHLQCLFEAGLEPIAAWHSQAMKCTGDLPGMDNAPFEAGPPAPGECVVGVAASGAGGWGPGYALSRKVDSCGAQFSGGKVLTAGQKISYRNVTCAVGADKLVACLDTSDGEHGFVLQPSGSTAF